MRVLVVEPSGGLWGSERALLDLISSASELEFAVCCPPDTPLVAELLRRGVKVLPWFVERLHEKSRWRRLQAAFGVLIACLCFRPRVIHINQSGAWRVVLPAATLLNLPAVCHVRIFEDVKYLSACAPMPGRLRSIIAISDSVEADIRSFKELDAIPTYRIYDAYVRSRPVTNIGRSRNAMACVGRVTPIKGQALLLQALALETLVKDAECLMVGDGDAGYVASLKGASPPSVKWCGVVGDVVGLLRGCRVLVCPSHREPLGRVIFEAWDAGALPVVFAGSGGAAEVVAGADAGLLYYEQAPEALALALIEAQELPTEEVDRLIANGRSWLDANCAPHAYGRAITRVLIRAATRG